MSYKVLVVDDNFVLLERLAAYLQRYGLDVVAESDPLRALQLMSERDDFFALVCDFQMPVMNGTELARGAKQRNATMLVLIISAMDAPDIPLASWDRWLVKGASTAADVVQELLHHSVFSKRVVETFGGEEELLSTMESLSRKLHTSD